MSRLCHNREWDGNAFGPIRGGDFTTCFEDVVLLPVSTWLLLLLSIPSVLSARRTRSMIMESKPSRKWWLILFDIVSAAIMGMYILEMVRLQGAHLGIGLLPFIPIGAALVIVLMHIHIRTRTTHVILTTVFIFWILLAIFSAVKFQTLVRIDHRGFKRKGSKYPTADQITDYIVILILTIIAALTTVLTPFVTRSRDRIDAGIRDSEGNIRDGGKI